MKNPEVDTYLMDGCGRCSYYQTPECKVHTWVEELMELRKIALDCGLHEDYKWSQPCYTLHDKNILIVTAFKAYACISFFKGALLKDPYKLLIKPGDSSQAARQLRFTGAKDILAMQSMIREYIFEAMEIEKSGLTIAYKKNPEPIPLELAQKMEEDTDLKSAFEALTPGRQRSYILHIGQAKQADTRRSRVEKCRAKIFSGKGFNEY